MQRHRFQTKAIHNKTMKEDGQRSIRYPVYDSVAFDFASAEDIEAAFAGKLPVHSYSRLSNPTVESFEKKMVDLEGAFAGLATSSGMAAVTNTMFTLMTAGDNFVTSSFLFGNTYSVMQKTFPGFGLEPRFVDITDLKAVESAIDENTRLIFAETISNPQMVVADVLALSEIAKRHHLILIIDSTLTTPWLFQGKQFGANILIHSTTKFTSGGATSVGGIILDIGNFDWTHIPALGEYHQLGEMALMARLKKEIFRNFGSCMAPQTAYLQSLGLETLSLRVDKACENALVVASYLQNHPKVKSVSYPALSNSPFNSLVKKQFKGKGGGVLSFELEDQETCFRFINCLKLVHIATNLNDNHSLIIHPASTIYRDFTPSERESMKVPEGLIRFSVGLEDVEDILEDLESALG